MDGAYYTGTARRAARRLLAVGLVAITSRRQRSTRTHQQDAASAPANPGRAAPA